MKKIFTTIVLLAMASYSFAAIRLVPSSYSSIQLAINASSNGDTVLVSKGTYFENINFNGENIVVASTFILNDRSGCIDSTIIDGNSNGSVVTFNNGETSNAMLYGFTIQNGNENVSGGQGGGIFCMYASPVIEYCNIKNNIAETSGGVYLGRSNSQLKYCIIENNQAQASGGGVQLQDSYQALAQYCIIRNNTITSTYGVNGGGGGVSMYHGGKLDNCLIVNNTAPNSVGGGVYIDWGTYSGQLFINNCTIADNSASSNGGINYVCYGGQISNTIIYNNTNGNYGCVNWCWGDNTFINCCTTPVPSGTGNIGSDPLFVNPSGDYHLQCGSPCVNAGDNSFVTGSFDLDGLPRIIDGNVDIGCYEYQLGILGGNQTVCAGTSVTLTATGGTSYQWSPSTGLSCTTCSNPVIPNPTATTTYTVTVTNASGCSAIDSVIVIVNLVPSITGQTGDTSTCPGVPVTLSVVDTVLDQSDWSGVLSGEMAGGPLYSGCTVWQSFKAGITGNMTQVDIGLNSPATVTLNIYSGVGIGGTLLSTTTQTFVAAWGWGSFTLSTPVPVVSGQNYTLNVVGSTSVQVLLFESPYNPYPNGTFFDVGCYSLPMDAMAFRTWVLPPYTYQWYGISQGEIAGATADTLSTSTADTYNCIVTGACAPAATSANMVLTVNTHPSQAATPTGLTQLCINTPNTNYTTTGATGATVYVWEISPSVAGTITGTGTTATVNWNSTYTGTAAINVKGINSCDSSGAFSNTLSVTINPLPTVYNVTGGGSYCEGGTGVDIELDGSDAGVNYLLYADDGDFYTGITVAGNGSTLNGYETSAGTYTIVATDASTGCTSLMNGGATVTVNALPTAGISYSGTPYCATGTATVTQTGQVGGTYTSTPGLVFVDANTGEVDLVASTAGTYTVTYSFSDGTCSNTTTSGITINALPTAGISYSGTPYCATGTATVTQTGQVGGTYTSTPGLVFVDANTGEVDLVASTAGTYTVTYSFSDGTCSNTTTSGITINALPTAGITGGGTVCSGSILPNVDIALTGTAPWSLTYAIDNVAQTPVTGITTSPYEITGAAAGTYTVTALSDANCTGTSFTGSATVTVYPTITADAGPDQQLCEQSTTTLTGNNPPFGSIGNWTFVSGPNIVTPSPSNSPAATVSGLIPSDTPYVFKYIVTSTYPGTSCSSFDTVKVTNFNFPSLPYPGPDQVLCLSSGTSTSTTVTGNTPVYGTGTWVEDHGPSVAVIANPANPSTIISNLIPGDYTFLWIIGNGICEPNQAAINITVMTPATASVGTNATICSNSTYTLSGSTATNALSLLWTTSGTGTFNDATLLHPVYTPSANDINAGSVYLYFTAFSATPCSNATSSMTLTINKAPIINAGANIAICQTSTYTLSGSTATNALSLLWTTSGTGTFNDSTLLHPVYNPSAADITAGSVVLTLTGTAPSACVDAVSSMTLTINSSARAGIGVAYDTICAGNNYALTSATVSNDNGLLWTTSGTGTFSNPAAVQPIYTPSTADINAGTVTLTLTADGNSPCVNATSTMTLVIHKAPFANAGADATVCQGTAYTVSGASASNYASILWTTSGTGSLTNATTLTPTYNPGVGETGLVTLTLTSYSNTGCASAAVSAMTITINGAATAGIGVAHDTICAGNNYALTSATVSNDNGLLWTTSGTGTFSNPAAVQPIYTPSAADITAGTVTLTLTADGNSLCVNATSTMTLVIHKAPFANAGADATVCQGTAYTVSGASASNYASILWTTSGTGSLTNATTLTPTYIPGVGETGLVTLTLTSYSNTGCASAAVSAMTITINGAATAGIGVAHDTICAGNNYALTSATVSNDNGLLWTTSGTGTFSNPAAVQPIYTPSAADITAGSVTLTLTAYGNAPCGNATSTMILTINMTPVADAGTDQTLCNETSTTMAGNVPTSGIGTWTLINGPNSPTITNVNLANTSITGMIAGTYVFRWTITNGTCIPSMDDVTIVNFALPTVSDAGAAQNLCDVTSITLEGNNPSSGTGLWTLLTAPNSPFINNISLYNTTVTNMIPGVYVFQWTINNGVCPSSQSTVTVTIYASPTSADAGINQNLCDVNMTNMEGNEPIVGTGTWTIISGPNNPIITNPNIYNTTITGMIPGTYVYQWTISNGTCVPSTSTVTITNSATPTIADAGTNQTLCGQNTTANLAANMPVNGTGSWTQVFGPNIATILNPLSANTQISRMIIGTYVFTWTISNGTCESSSSNVGITIKDCGPIVPDTITTTPENNTVEICIPFTDPEGSGPFIVSLGCMNNGSALATIDGMTICVTYTPNSNFNGIDTVCITLCDAEGACTESWVAITVTPNQIIIPSGFSPDGDGINDYFVISNINNYPKNHLWVYNRWGNLVYEKQPYDNSWDGKRNVNGVIYGDDLSEGTYFYIFDLGNNTKPYQGYVIIKK